MPESAIRINSAAVRRRLTDNLLLDEPVSVLRYVSRARLQGLERLGILTLGDLVNHYPFRYNDFSQTVPIALASLSEKSTVLGLIHEITVKRPRPRLTIIEVTLVDDSGMCILSFFNQPWLAKQLQAGLRLICLGQMEHNYGYRRMSSPLFSVVEQTDSQQTIQAVYRANSDISQGWLRRLINQALEQCGEMLDPLPASLRIQQGLVNKRSAIWSVHHPSSS
ncbi:MAG: ATP-dependent DNA helicase RecG, partial [Coriobacteriales bacterium]|nr:ATP-dependent DNA helicase RecG [Coriobacteriales bacterium]